MSNILKYENKNLKCPKYMFHGSAQLLNEIKVQKAHDSKGTKENIDTAVFITPSIQIASAYAFKDSIKKNTARNQWKFSISDTEKEPIMTMENVDVPSELIGYIYVFENNSEFVNSPLESLQYKSYKDLVPIDIIRVNYSDFKELYEVKRSK